MALVILMVIVTILYAYCCMFFDFRQYLIGSSDGAMKTGF